jgi:hypothetical protein
MRRRVDLTEEERSSAASNNKSRPIPLASESNTRRPKDASGYSTTGRHARDDDRANVCFHEHAQPEFTPHLR